VNEILVSPAIELPAVKQTKLQKLSNIAMMRDLGVDSDIFYSIRKALHALYDRAKLRDFSQLHHIFKKWKDIFSNIYGNQLSFEIFIRHVYLTLILKSVLYLKVTSSEVNEEDVKELLSGEFFDQNELRNLFDINLTIWLADELLIDDSYDMVNKIIKILDNYSLNDIEEDIFRGLYEQLIGQSDRHKAGEYYTPRWLVELILDQAFLNWNNEFPPRIIDPSCGSGVFLFHAIRYLKNKYELSSAEILKCIAGIDMNPLAVMVAKTNLLLALSNVPGQHIPVYFQDALKESDLFRSKLSMERYDIIIGNPPWIVLRSLKEKKYQNFIKKEMFRYKLITNGNAHLHTQLDLATLFFRKCADNYLKNQGIIAFVMPRSVIGHTLQNQEFRKFESPDIKLLKILDLERVGPLFNMPTCVLIGIKGDKTIYPVSLERYAGNMPSRDLNYSQVRSILHWREAKYTPLANESKQSYYYDKFKVGLSIFPRSLYFADLLSINSKSLKIKTCGEILRIVKEPWNQELTGKIEKDFIFGTVLPWEMVPFGFLNMRPVILPLLIENNRFELLNINRFDSLGYCDASNWFMKTQEVWDSNKTSKSKERFPLLIDRLNYNNLLSFQHPGKRYVVLYNATGKNITSCVIDRFNLPSFRVADYLFSPKGFVADVKTWFFETNSEDEAYYLTTVLNSPVLNELIKPFQPRGLFGARAIHRRPLQFPIPKFDSEIDSHNQLASAGKAINGRVKALIQKKYSKNYIRKIIISEIEQIDNFVKKLLKQ